MDMKLKRLIANGETLHEFGDSVQVQIISDFLYNPERTKRFEKTFEKYFSGFVVFFSVVNEIKMNNGQLERIKLLLQAARALNRYYTLHELADSLMLQEYKESPQASHFNVILQNAIVYAIASTYKGNIPSMYMRAKREMHGTVVAKYAGYRYILYTEATHPLLSGYIDARFKLSRPLIKEVVGYLVNPSLIKK